MTGRKEHDKVVFVLGAGFSKRAGMPLQSKILRLIIETGLIGSPMLKEVLASVFSTDDSTSLEDVFTLFDTSIEARNNCLHFTWKDLDSARDLLVRAIISLFCDSQKSIDGRDWRFYEGIAYSLIRDRVVGGIGEDLLAIVSLNWDSVLEDVIYALLARHDLTKTVDIDYCCYTKALDDDSDHINSLVQKSLGRHNIKVMKLHGSVSWLLCSNCRRLYTTLGSRSGVLDLMFPRHCEECSKLVRKMWKGDAKKLPVLEPFLVTPTYVKAFPNPHIQMVWHNAQINLAEADEVVIIGYSMPDSDFHVRNLFRRSIRDDSRITVVLPQSDRKPAEEDGRAAVDTTHGRYQRFFAGRNLNFRFGGVEGYFNYRKACRRDEVDSRMVEIKQMIETENSSSA